MGWHTRHASTLSGLEGHLRPETLNLTAWNHALGLQQQTTTNNNNNNNNKILTFDHRNSIVYYMWLVCILSNMYLYIYIYKNNVYVFVCIYCACVYYIYVCACVPVYIYTIRCMLWSTFLPLYMSSIFFIIYTHSAIYYIYACKWHLIGDITLGYALLLRSAFEQLAPTHD